jgi:hypothetical protein
LLLFAPKRGWHLCSINTGPYGENTEIYTTIQCKKYKDHEIKEKFFDWKKTASKLDEKPEGLKSLYRSPGDKKNQLVLCKNYVLQW